MINGQWLPPYRFIQAMLCLGPSALRFLPAVCGPQGYPIPFMTKKRTKPPRTQYFSSALLLFMEKNHINQVQLSDATGVAISRINNYLHGKYRTIRPDHLEALVKSATRAVAERDELIRAYLLDLLPEGLQSVIRIEGVRDGGKTSARHVAMPKTPNLPITTAAALAELQLLGARSAKARSRLEIFAEILHEAHGI
jgi:transcriptional regulator with XRE-family HTH domain